MCIELSIHEGGFDECLTVVEHAVHLYRCDVLAQRGELALLYGTYLSFGVEHIYVYAVHSQESVGYSRTGIAASGHQHVYLFVIVLLLDKVLQQSGHKSSAYILKCQRWSVE